MNSRSRRRRERAARLLQGEAFYDAEIAPRLRDVMRRCEAHGMSLVTVVEYAPGERGRSCALQPNAGLAMVMVNHCAKMGEDVDGYMFGLRKFCAKNGIDFSRSLYLCRYDSPTAWGAAHARAGAVVVDGAARVADLAVTYVLDRAQTDADLGYLIGPMTEAFAKLCAAEAAYTGEDVETVTARRSVSHARYPRRYLSEGDWRDRAELAELADEDLEHREDG